MDFSVFIDNTPLGPTYQQTGIGFTQLGTTPVMFINATAGQVGLQFPDAGLEIRLPGLSYEVTMMVGTFARPVTLETRDPFQLVSSQIINTANTYQTIVINPVPCISSLTFRGGHNEVILVQICVKYCTPRKADPGSKTHRDTGG